MKNEVSDIKEFTALVNEFESSDCGKTYKKLFKDPSVAYHTTNEKGKDIVVPDVFVCNNELKESLTKLFNEYWSKYLN